MSPSWLGSLRLATKTSRGARALGYRYCASLATTSAGTARAMKLATSTAIARVPFHVVRRTSLSCAPSAVAEHDEGFPFGFC